jgi:MFS family permease
MSSNTALAGARVQRTSPGLVLAAVCVACGLLPISLTGASVALPSIGTGLHTGIVGVQWVVNGYDLTFASIMLAAGSLADRVGRRRIFGIGLAIFAICSLLAGLAPNALVIDLARAAAGIGAAGVLTSGAAILAETFQDGAARARAFAFLGTSFGFGIAFGPALSGFEVHAFGWRGVFLSHAIVAGLVFLTVPMIKVSAVGSGGRADWGGTVTFSGSLFLFIFALIEGPQWGWGSTSIVAALVGSVVLMAAFVIVERRSSHPMFDIGLFRNGRFVAISLVPVALAFGFTAVLMFLPSYFTAVDNRNAQQVGLLLLLLTAPTLVLPIVAGKLTRWLSTRVILAISLLATAAGAGWLTVLHPGASLLTLAGPLITIGAGFGFSLGVLDGAAISTVEVERAGMAAGMFNTMRLASEVVAIAAMGSALLSFTQQRVSGSERAASGYPGSATALANSLGQGDLASAANTVPAGSRDAFITFAANAYTDAFRIALWLLAGVCVATTVVVVGLLRDRRSPATAPAVENLEVATQHA